MVDATDAGIVTRRKLEWAVGSFEQYKSSGNFSEPVNKPLTKTVEIKVSVNQSSTKTAEIKFSVNQRSTKTVEIKFQ